MSAHTLGPWNFRRVNNVDHYRCVPTDTQDRELLKAVPIDRIAEVEANARLIAAAPAMLEALQHLMTAFRVMRDRHATQWDLSVTPDLCTAWDEAKEAIRLAEGRG